MLVDGVLQLFPPHGLDQSILVAVLLGMLVLLFLTEVFGWVFVGLVVPGYLSSVAVIQPASAIAVLFEAMITFVLVRFVSEGLSRFKPWSPFFGRERFLLIVMISVVVRQNSQIWILPVLLRHIDDTFGTSWYTDLDFYSIGLVLIPLTANMCWKLGVWRGSLQIGVPTIITYLLLQFVLLPYTNLSFGNLALTYENVALDFLGSPKAYMILLTGSFLAAHYNVKYGWDYNGIMVPSLMALAWFSPPLVLLTVVEALLLLGLMRLVMALPMMRTVNLEGPRKVSLIFILGFFLKFVSGWVSSSMSGGVHVTEFFGFGYVLTSLIAVKMLNVRAVGRVVLPTVQVSLTAFLVGSLIGYTLDQIAPDDTRPAKLDQRHDEPTRMLLREPLGVMAMAEVRARPAPPVDIRDGRSAEELKTYTCLWRGLDRWVADNGSELPATVLTCARKLGLEVRPVDAGLAPNQRAFAVLDGEEHLAEQTGWDTGLLFPGAPGPYIEVPSPRLESPAALAATFLCKSIQCRGILVSGGDSRQNNAANALTHVRSTFEIAHRQLESAPVIQLRADVDALRGRPVLHLKHTLPPSIQLQALWPQAVELRWQPPPNPMQQWGMRHDFVVFRVHPEDLWQRLLDQSPGAPAQKPDVDIESFVAPLVERSDDPLDPNVPEVILPSETELHLFERLLADDLLQGRWERIPWLTRLAHVIDYQIAFLPDCAGPADGCWVLMQNDAQTRYPMGLLAVRTGESAPIAVEIPRPQRELGTLRIGIELWIESRGHALLVNPDEKVSGTGMRLDPTIIGNPVTPFQAGHQAIHHSLAIRTGHAQAAPGLHAGVGLAPDAAADDMPASDAGADREPPADSASGPDERDEPAPGLIIQMRGFGGWRAVEDDMVVGIGPPVMQTWQIPQRLRGIVAPEGPLGWLSDSMRYADGSDQLDVLAGQGTPQLTFSRAFGQVDFAMVWLSEDVRQRYRPATRERYAEHFQRSGFALVTGEAYDALMTPPLAPAQGEMDPDARAELDRLVELARHYAVTRDIHILRALHRAHQRNPDVEVEALWSGQLSLPILLIQMTHGPYTARALVLMHPAVETPCPQRDATTLAINEVSASQALRRCGVITHFGIIGR